MYGKYEYLAVKKQTAFGTYAKPDTFIEFDDADVNPGYEGKFRNVAVASRSKNGRYVKGKNGPVTGTLKLPVQSKTYGHILQMAYGAPQTSGPTDSAYTHVFTPSAAGTLVPYTMDFALIGKGYVHRFLDMVASSIKNAYSDDYLTADVGLFGLAAFKVARVTTTASSGTALVISSTLGLTLTDTIIVSQGDGTNSEELTISNINADGVTLTTSTISKTHIAGDRVVIKASTPSYTTGSQFTGVGGSQFYIGTTLAGVAAYDAEDFTLDFTQNLASPHALTGVKEADRWPTKVLPNDYEFKTTFKWYHDDPKWTDYARDRSQLATKLEATGDLIGATATDLLRLELPDIRLDSDPFTKYGQAGTVEDELKATAKPDASNGFTGRTTLICAVATL